MNTARRVGPLDGLGGRGVPVVQLGSGDFPAALS